MNQFHSLSPEGVCVVEGWQGLPKPYDGNKHHWPYTVVTKRVKLLHGVMGELQKSQWGLPIQVLCSEWKALPL